MILGFYDIKNIQDQDKRLQWAIRNPFKSKFWIIQNTYFQIEICWIKK